MNQFFEMSDLLSGDGRRRWLHHGPSCQRNETSASATNRHARTACRTGLGSGSLIFRQFCRGRVVCFPKKTVVFASFSSKISEPDPLIFDATFRREEVNLTPLFFLSFAQS